MLLRTSGAWIAMTKPRAALSCVMTGSLILLGSFVGTTEAADKTRPNILFIVLDDQNAFAGRTDLAPEPVSPNLNRLAKAGTNFVNAQCAAPVCNPSRTAFLSGLRPSTTGIYDNSQDSTPQGHILTRTISLPTYFQQQGYKTAGGGKIFGSSFGSLLKNRLWDESPERNNRENGKHDPAPPKEQINALGKHEWGYAAVGRDKLEDWTHAGWAAAFLRKPQPKPFFLACGIVKPHTPWFVPKEYYDLFPPERIVIPDLAKDEAAGVPAGARERTPKINAQLVARRKELVSAYLASSRYADDCVGRILDGLDQGLHRGNTIVVILGDNGYQFGEKNAWSKGRLWEGSANVPLVMAGPGIPQNQTSARPVSLVDLYPTLVELAGLPTKPGLDGVSLVPLLKNPTLSWERPALTTSGCKNHALRSERWRYIRYEDGSEELYDHDRDPLERTNLASNPEFVAIKQDMQKWLPKHDEPRNPNPKGRKSDD